MTKLHGVLVEGFYLLIQVLSANIIRFFSNFLSLIEITYKSVSLTLKIQMLNSFSVMLVKILFPTANQHLNDKKDNHIDIYNISSLSNPQKVKRLS